jgi:hypothetical protein
VRNLILNDAIDFYLRATMDLQTRYAAIQQKEEDLRRREATLRKQHIDVNDQHAPNFPPFYPMMYHNIAEEIPIAMQWFLKLALIGIAGMLVVAFVNWISCFTSKSFTPSASTSAVIENVIFGGIVGLLTAPLAFRVTYRREYDQCKAGSITLWTLALQGLLFAWITICAVGMHGMGTVGVIMTIDAFSSSANGFTKAMAAISCLLWLLIALLELFLLGRLLILYKTVGSNGAVARPPIVPESTE